MWADKESNSEGETLCGKGLTKTKAGKSTWQGQKWNLNQKGLSHCIKTGIRRSRNWGYTVSSSHGLREAGGFIARAAKEDKRNGLVGGRVLDMGQSM